jgi:hypothetical protein
MLQVSSRKLYGGSSSKVTPGLESQFQKAEDDTDVPLESFIGQIYHFQLCPIGEN